MTYNSLLLIKSNHLILFSKNNKYKVKLSKKALKNGRILNYEIFSNEYLSFLKNNKIIKVFWNKDISVLHNCSYTTIEIKYLNEIFKDMNYRNVTLINEKKLLKFDKTTNYLLTDGILRLFYIDEFNSKKVMILDSEIYYKNEIKMLIMHRSRNKDLIIVGDLPIELIDKKLNYYFYDDFDEFFLKNYI